MFRNILLVLTFTLGLPFLSIAQSFPDEYYLVQNCQCSTYKVIYPNKSIYNRYSVSKSSRIVSSVTVEDGEAIQVDSFYYNNDGKIVKIQNYFVFSGVQEAGGYSLYEYTSSGKISAIKFYRGNTLAKMEEYHWDEKNRPLVFSQSYYLQGALKEQYKMLFDFINDTTALLEYRDYELVAKGKRIYDRSGNLLQESLENIKKGKKVNFNWKYDKKGRVQSIHKSRVIGGDILLFGSEHYTFLFDASRKMIFEYDNKGRLSQIKLYENPSLDKLINYDIVFDE